jgi:ATP-dependent Lon protease
MQGGLLPLFPLNIVVFPRTKIPLHIFEDRYKEMVGEAIRDQSEFGIVLAKEEGVLQAGCTVRVENVLKNYPDGRMDIVTAGVRRFEIVSLNQEKNYLRGEVGFYEDDDPEPAAQELRVKAIENYRAWLEVEEARPFSDPVLSDPQLSFQLAQALPDLDFRQILLGTRSESERLRQLTQFLSDSIVRQRVTSHMRKLAPTNGHGAKPPMI